MTATQEWKLSSLKEAGVVLIDCDHRTPPAVEVGYPYIAIPQLKNGHINLSGVRKISPDHFEEWTRKAKPQHHDVILSRRCNPGETAHVPENLKCALGQNLVLLRADGKKVVPQYLRWIAQGPLWWEQISKFINVGAVFDSLRCADVPKFELPIPPIPEQRAIAAVLGALDDKIELNSRMNATLEAAARALFKSWFVDFDPVKAKMEGRAPFGMDATTAALFPAHLTESELGDIPEGWQPKEIGDLVKVAGGGTPSTTNPDFWADAGHYWATPKDLSNLSSPVLLRTERQISAAGLGAISSGLLPEGTVLMSSRAPIGYIAIAEVPVAINQGFIALICTDALPNLFVWLWLHQNMDAIKGRANGSTFQEISKSNFRPLPVVLPSPKVLAAFTEIASPLWHKIVSNHKENERLIKGRDYLLPKLISGEIRIPDAEKFVEGLV